MTPRHSSDDNIGARLRKTSAMSPGVDCSAAEASLSVLSLVFSLSLVNSPGRLVIYSVRDTSKGCWKRQGYITGFKIHGGRRGDRRQSTALSGRMHERQSPKVCRTKRRGRRRQNTKSLETVGRRSVDNVAGSDIYLLATLSL